jgi:hypothetical protein
MTNIRQMLKGEAEPLDIIRWLRAEYMPLIVERFNKPDVRRRLGLYAGDKIPENERNLTDTRNRVSLIGEYELARLSNEYLREVGIKDIFWAYVVANRFPDLEVRDADGRRGLRIEVKCLQSLAEEKSANFDTLKKDLHPGTDCIVVFLWEWMHDPGPVKWDKAPKIIKAFIFHAYTLAEMRDHYWLNTPPTDLGNGFQGFDLRHGVTHNVTDGYKEEEGNYGKLTRIWDKNFRYPIKKTPLIDDTEEEYEKFLSHVVAEGFEILCSTRLPKIAGDGTITSLTLDGHEIGKAVNEIGFVRSALVTPTKLIQLIQKYSLQRIITFSDKYSWSVKGIESGRLINVSCGRKPKYLSRAALHLPGN